MKSIFFFGIILSLSLCSLADEGEAGNAEDLSEMWADIKAKACKPDTLDDKAVTALLECKSHLNKDHDKAEEKHKEIRNHLYEKCGKPNEKDVEGYTKVDLKNESHKSLLMSLCSEGMHKCFQDLVKAWKEKHANSGEEHKSKGKHKFHLTAEQKTKLKECADKALAGSR